MFAQKADRGAAMLLAGGEIQFSKFGDGSHSEPQIRSYQLVVANSDAFRGSRRLSHGLPYKSVPSAKGLKPFSENDFAAGRSYSQGYGSANAISESDNCPPGTS